MAHPRTTFTAATVLTLALATPLAVADEAPPASPTPDATFTVGARIGGYGFRRDDGDQRSAWDECRMNGAGVFGTIALRGPLFVELGLDGYFSEHWPLGASGEDLPIDRQSALASAAIGVAVTPHPRLTAYAQLGAGVELTHVSVPYGERRITDDQVLPDGYLGIGGDVRVVGKVHAGASFRVHAMGNFAYDPAKLEMEAGWTTPPSADQVFDASPDVAAQGQFYLRYDL